MIQAYINGIGAISPQQSMQNSLVWEETAKAKGGFLKCQEPKYKEYINPKLVRRMSRIIRMGVTTAQLAVNNLENKTIDAIITGTALGCLQDTEKFLEAICENDEQYLTPTAFVQSTHNTVGGQIALLQENYNYNYSYVHRGFSFESAVLDALMQLTDGEAQQVLVGGIDELTSNTEKLLNLLNCTSDEATVWGEGASFFVLAKEKQSNSYAKIEGLTMIYKPSKPTEVAQHITSFLAEHQLTNKDIDLVLLGNEGFRAADLYYKHLENNLFAENIKSYFKQLCGEYATNSAFALWLASLILKEQKIPVTLAKTANKPIKKILIYNQHRGINHSLILVSQC